MHNVFPKSVRYRMLARRIYEDDGGVTTMTGKQWRDLAGVWRLTEKTQRDVKAGLEKVGLRVVSMPHTQGDVVVVYHPQTYAGPGSRPKTRPRATYGNRAVLVASPPAEEGQGQLRTNERARPDRGGHSVSARTQ